LAKVEAGNFEKNAQDKKNALLGLLFSGLFISVISAHLPIKLRAEIVLSIHTSK